MTVNCGPSGERLLIKLSLTPSDRYSISGLLLALTNGKIATVLIAAFARGLTPRKHNHCPSFVLFNLADNIFSARYAVRVGLDSPVLAVISFGVSTNTISGAVTMVGALPLKTAEAMDCWSVSILFPTLFKSLREMSPNCLITVIVCFCEVP